jgi:hypothetical protein
MKTVQNPVVKIAADGKSGTVSFDIVDNTYNGILTSRTSHGYCNPDNMRHRRYIQSSNEAVFVESAKARVAFMNHFFAIIAAYVDPLTTFAPEIKKGSALGVVNQSSETPVSYQWQVSNNAFPLAVAPHTPPPPAVWTDVQGQTAASLDESIIKTGQSIRCIITNSTGVSITKPAKKV